MSDTVNMPSCAAIEVAHYLVGMKPVDLAFEVVCDADERNLAMKFVNHFLKQEVESKHLTDSAVKIQVKKLETIFVALKKLIHNHSNRFIEDKSYFIGHCVLFNAEMFDFWVAILAEAMGEGPEVITMSLKSYYYYGLLLKVLKVKQLDVVKEIRPNYKKHFCHNYDSAYNMGSMTIDSDYPENQSGLFETDEGLAMDQMKWNTKVNINKNQHFIQECVKWEYPS